MKRAKSAEIALKGPNGIAAGDYVAVFADVCVQFLGAGQRLAKFEERVRQCLVLGANEQLPAAVYVHHIRVEPGRKTAQRGGQVSKRAEAEPARRVGRKWVLR